MTDLTALTVEALEREYAKVKADPPDDWSGAFRDGYMHGLDVAIQHVDAALARPGAAAVERCAECNQPPAAAVHGYVSSLPWGSAHLSHTFTQPAPVPPALTVEECAAWVPGVVRCGKAEAEHGRGPRQKRHRYLAALPALESLSSTDQARR